MVKEGVIAIYKTRSRRHGDSIEFPLNACEAGIDDSAENGHSSCREKDGVPTTGEVLNPS